MVGVVGEGYVRALMTIDDRLVMVMVVVVVVCVCDGERELCC